MGETQSTWRVLCVCDTLINIHENESEIAIVCVREREREREREIEREREREIMRTYVRELFTLRVGRWIVKIFKRAM